MTVRICAGCRKPSSEGRGPVIAFLGAYWHRVCFAKASEQQRQVARAMAHATVYLVGQNDRECHWASRRALSAGYRFDDNRHGYAVVKINLAQGKILAGWRVSDNDVAFNMDGQMTLDDLRTIFRLLGFAP